MKQRPQPQTKPKNIAVINHHQDASIRLLSSQFEHSEEKRRKITKKMQKKMEVVAKKRGRPRKFKKQSTDDVPLTKRPNVDASIPPSCPLDNASSTDTASRIYRTRHSQAAADEQVFVSTRLYTKSTFPMESPYSKSPVESQDLPSQHEIISPSKSVGTQDGTTISSGTGQQLIPYKNLFNLDKFSSHNLAQAHENNEVKSDNIEINGYKVKRELEPLVKAIFIKYGDICKESVLSLESRPVLLEWVCSIYKRLEASTFVELTSAEFNTMVSQMKDLELMKMEVGWLSQRLSQISKAREIYVGASTIKDVEARTNVMIGEKKKAIESYEKEVKKLQEKIQQEKGDLDMVDEIKKLLGKSLVNGLV